MNDTFFRFEDLLEDLQIYILARLPRKLLSKCKCVCRHWNTTLTIQAFMYRHSRSHGKPSNLAFVAHKLTKGYDSVLSFELCDKTTPNRKTMTVVPKTTKMSVETSGKIEELIIGQHKRFSETLFRRHMNSNICNDLICLYGWHSPLLGLLNLKTQDFIYLPPVTRQRVGPIRVWYALGFDPVNNVYKVLSIYGGTKVYAATFIIGSKHWKRVEYKFLRCAATRKWDYWKRNNSLCLDGVIYWVNDYEICGTSVLTVVGFDLNHEVFTDYKLDTMPIKDAEKIRYYLTSLKGNPTLFIWEKYSNEIQQLTLFNHKNPKADWNRRSFIARDFPRDFPYGGPDWTFVAGSSILLHPVKSIKSSMKSREQDKSLLSWHRWYDLENFAIE